MTVGEQLQLCAEFYQRALHLMSSGKASDYAPEGAIFLDVFQAAADMRTSPEAVFLGHMRKHLTAIRRWINYRTLRSETVESRLLDMANYIAFLDIMRTRGDEVARAVLIVAERHECDFAVGDQLITCLQLKSDEPCDRCLLMGFTQSYLQHWPNPVPMR